MAVTSGLDSKVEIFVAAAMAWRLAVGLHHGGSMTFCWIHKEALAKSRDFQIYMRVGCGRRGEGEDNGSQEKKVF